MDTLSALATWTPFLLEGFALNILIAVVAMLLGTAAGAVVARMRLAAGPGTARAGRALTEVTRNIPTIVFQFYLVLMLPSELRLGTMDLVVPVPAWLLAAAALAMAVIGFTADNLASALAHWRRGDHTAALLFVPSWTSYLLIIVIASSTASIIGVNELVSRSNAVINASGGTHLMLPVYAYACAIFFCFCYPLTLLMRHVQARLHRRVALQQARPALSPARESCVNRVLISTSDEQN